MKRTLGSAVVVVLVLGLGGCSGGSDARPVALPTLSTATPTGLVTASPTIRADVPAAARAHTPQGAVAFVRFYYSQVNASATGAGPEALDGLQDPGCKACLSYIATAEDFLAKGERIDGVPVRVVFAEAPPEQDGLIAVAVTLDAPARKRVRLDGTLVRALPADPAYQRSVYVKWMKVGWTLRAVVGSGN